MRYSIDDSIYAVDNVWLGPPGKTFLWRARYVAYFLGAIVFVLVQIVERRLGLKIGIFSIAWGLVATVLITRGVLRLVNYDRTLLSLFTAVSNEISAPRRNDRVLTVTLRPGKLATLGDDAWEHKPARSDPLTKLLTRLRRGEPHKVAAPEPTENEVLDGSQIDSGTKTVKLETTGAGGPRRVPRLTLRRAQRVVVRLPQPDDSSALSVLPHYGRDRGSYASSSTSSSITSAHVTKEPS